MNQKLDGHLFITLNEKNRPQNREVIIIVKDTHFISLSLRSRPVHH